MNTELINIKKQIEEIWEQMLPIQKERQDIFRNLEEKEKRNEQPTEKELMRLQSLSVALEILEIKYNDFRKKEKEILRKILKNLKQEEIESNGS